MTPEGPHTLSSGEASSSSSKIPLYLINGVATVWEAQTAATLHCTYGISGLRAGTLPGVSQQNAFLGLPMTLTPEETAWCVNQGVAHLIPLDPSRRAKITANDVEANSRKRMETITAYREAQMADSARKEAIARQAYEKGGEKARLKREARAKAKAEALAKVAAAAAAESEDGASGSGQSGLELFGLEKIGESSRASLQAQEATSDKTAPVDAGDSESLATTKPSSSSSSILYPHTVPSHPLFPDIAFGEPITALPHPSFPFPRTPRDHALLATFTSLLDRGYRIGLGPRFGGEYLVYPGDYLRYHAHFTSQVLVRDEPIRPMEIVAWGRLGTGTKKAGLLCCWDDETPDDDVVTEDSRSRQEEVEFYSLEWANFG